MRDCISNRSDAATEYRVLVGGSGGGDVGNSWTVGRGAWRRRYCCALAAAILLATGSLLLSGVCLWTQRGLEAENFVVREEVEFLETKLQMFEEELLERGVAGGSETSSEVQVQSKLLAHRRLRRSSSESNRKRKTHPKAIHFRLDANPGGSTTTDLKWNVWTGSDNAAERHAIQFTLESTRLSEDKKSFTISEPGLYFIYAQIHFENAKPRNAFAVKVDDSVVIKCFQSLDYFNQSLTSTENSRLKPCYSAATIVLRLNQVVTIANLYPSNRIINDPYANFWGLVKLAEN